MATVDTSPSDTDSNPYIASLIYGNRWSGTVTYSFGVTSGQTWTSTEMQAFRNAFAAWSAVCNITFAQNTSGTANFTEYEATSATWDDPPGRITLADHHIVGTGNGSDGGQTEGRYNTNHSSWSDLAVGGMGYSTIVHELGHAIGLDHPHDAAELFPGVERGNAFGDLGDNNQNQAIWTIMSYNRGWNGQPATSNAFGHAGGPMAFDIAAVQRLYGANMTTRTGSDTYALPQANVSGTFWSCIWDAGGNDTISNANGTTASTINLQAAPLTGANAGGYVSWVGGIAGGFTIANGVVIENAIGGKAGDTITGNDAANVLEGGAGGDVIDGKLGNDTASYASSVDGVVIDLRRASLETTNSNYLAPAGGDAAGDTLISIENLIGSRKNDVLHGRDATGSTIDGGAGDDTLFGYLGNDVIRGGMGADTIKDTGGNDVIYGGDSNFIRNGSFEVVASPTFDANGYGYNEPIDGWTLLSGSRLELFKAGSAAGAPSDGKYGVDLEGNQANTNVAISQVVSGLTDGQLYRIAFDVRRVAGADAKFEVYWGGTKVDLTTAGAKEMVPSTDGTTYYIGVFGGVGTGSDKNRLTFREIGGGDAHGTLLDNVRMYRDAGGTNPAANAYDPFIDGNDTITVGTGSDTVYGHGGDDTVTFSDIGPGTDQFDGGSGNDLLVMDWSNSTTQIIYRGVATSGTPQLSPDIGQAESYTRSGAAFGEADQKLFFNQVERFNLKGGTGNDTLKGGEFNDILIGNRGDDTLNGGGGVDEINGGEGFDRAVIVLSGSGANTLVLKQMQSGGSVTLSNGTKLTSIEAIDLEAGEGDDFLDVRGTVVNPAGLASTYPSFKSTSTNFSGKGGNDTLAVDLATSDSVKFDGGAGSGDLFIMDWSAATRDIFRDTGDGAYRSYQKTINVVTGGQTYTTEYYYTASFTGVERFDLTGGSGNDVLYGGSGNDRLNGFTGRDTLAFGAGSDTLVLDWTGYSYGVGGGVNGSLAAGYDGSYSTGYSSTYAVTFTGAEHFDLTLTENGDSVATGDGNDIVRGNGGNDTLDTAKGIDIVDGGAGTADRWIADKSALTATQAMVLDLTRSGTQATYLGTGTVTGIEALTLTTGAGADIITTLAGDLNDTVKTMGGADVVKLAGGRDVVDLGAGSDTLVIDWSGYGYQVGTGVTGGSLTAGYSGNFQTGYSSTYYAEFAGVEQFDLTLGDATGGDNVTTGDGNDIVRGMAGNDTLNTAKGIDKVYGGDGIDRWVADQSAMTTAQAMVLDLTLAGTQAAYRGTGIVADVEATDLITGAGADRIVTRFSDLNDTVTTGIGNDRVTVAGGRDTVNAGADTDTLVLDWTGYGYNVSGGVGTGSLEGGYDGNLNTGYSSTYAVTFTGVEHFILTLGDATGGDTVATGDGDDTVKGMAGNDTLDTAKGIDIVDGGAGTADRWIADKSAMTATQAMVLDLTRSGTQATYLGTGTVTGIEALTLTTGAGADIITTLAGDLNDTLTTGAGNDRVKVAGGRDAASMGTGSDTLVLDWTDYAYGVYVGVEAGTLASGYDGNFNTGYSSTYAVTFTGVEHFDLILSGQADSVRTGDGNDAIKAGVGNDTLRTGKGIDTVDGGSQANGDRGIDIWSADKSAATVGMTIDLTALVSTYVIDGVTATARNIEALGLDDEAGWSTNRFLSGSGSDTIVTRGEFYRDVIGTGAGNDRVTVAGGRDDVAMGEGTDTLVLDWTGYAYGVGVGVATGSLTGGYDGNFNTGYSSTNRVDFTGTEQFDLTLTENGDSVATGDGNDIVRGNGGNDTLDTAKGIDIVDGGAGTADRWIADKSAMTATQAMVLDLTRSGTQATYLGTGTVTGIEALTLTTGAGADFITTLAGDLNDTLTTGAGNDRVKVAGGRDAASMGTGSDTLVLDWTGYGYGVSSGVEAGTLATGYDGNFNTGYSSTYAVTFTGVEHFDLILTGNVDSVRTGDGNDILNGGGGADTLVGAGGNDTYVVDVQGDRPIESAAGGTDTVKASVSYILETGQELEILTTTNDAGKDAINLTGNERVNTLRGNAGANTLDGGLGADTMAGLAGSDTYLVDVTGDKVYEAAAGGTDTVKVAATAVSYALLAGQEVEALVAADAAGTAALNLTGNGFGQTITGNAGANLLRGGGGNDVINGGGGIDTVDYRDKTVAVEVALNGSTAVNVTVGGVVEDKIVNVERVIGGTAADKLTGNGLANVLDGWTGADTLTGGGGGDTYFVDNLADKVIEAVGGGLDTVKASVSYILAAGQEVETLVAADAAGTAALNLTGNEFAQTMTGNAGANLLRGGGGNDVINGGGGIDTVDYRDKTVAVEVALKGSTTVGVAVGGVAEDKIVYVENVTGGAAADKLTGDGLANILDGWTGADTLTGGGGGDTYFVDNLADKVIEAAGGGIDTVLARSTYGLAENQEIEILATAAPTSTATLNLTGNAFAQAITGNAGINILTGGGGVDRLTGGLGRDTFDFNAKTDSGATSTTRDVVLDFTQGEDRIDLSTIDANGALAGDAFEFLANAGSAFTGKAGQLAFVTVDATGTASDRTVIQADMDGNKVADFQIELKGLYTLTSADFVL